MKNRQECLALLLFLQNLLEYRAEYLFDNVRRKKELIVKLC